MKKIAIVTGATGNLGEAVVKKLLKEKYFVVGTVHHDPLPHESANEQYEAHKLDLLNEAQSQKLLDDVINKHGEINVAILTAGGFAMNDIAATKTSDIFQQYQLNFETAYNIARPVFLQMMKQKSGRIFLIGSKPGLDVSKAKGMTAYALSKSLIFRLAELMNAESKGKNVVTNVIVPGTIDTPQNRKSMPDANFSDWVTPSQIAEVIHFYCTDAAKNLREPVIKVYNNS